MLGDRRRLVRHRKQQCAGAVACLKPLLDDDDHGLSEGFNASVVPDFDSVASAL